VCWSAGLLQRHLSAQLKRAQRQVFKSGCNNSLSFWFWHHEAFSTEELLNWRTGLMVTGLSQVQCTLGVDYLSAIQDCCLWYKWFPFLLHRSLVLCCSSFVSITWVDRDSFKNCIIWHLSLVFHRHSSIVGCGSMGCTPAEIGHPVFAIASVHF